ncbi:uncharacterized protein A1O5_10750 [Cladophialophora psammophila CBS 110553]|uniref:Uncharacterized protein n=1 Tax=Cladophialophora psammophila CBS 110553 TaxID=1182543 RepID=W9WMA3_9EURO|nr:uncharacterized protein A1O5_10750 [Cladophialophora psammophila CBS 110553]EXJ66135.1 hypothetical protein A1O5_10750 [Cladophialophora psammophila CBS 110553]
MAAPRPILPIAANESQSEDPRGANSIGPTQMSSQASALTVSGLDDFDQEFAHLSALLQAELYGSSIQDDSSLNGLLGSIPEGINQDLTAVGNIAQGLNTTDNLNQGLSATGYTAQGLATTEDFTQGFAATEDSDPSADFNAFFGWDGASLPAASNVTDELALAFQGVGSQFNDFDHIPAQDFTVHPWQNGNLNAPDPSVFPPGFEKAANVASSTPIRFNAYAVEGLEGELPELPETNVPDLASMARDFARSAAVDLLTLGATDPGVRDSEICSLPPPSGFVSSQSNVPGHTYVAAINNNITAPQTDNTMARKTVNPLYPDPISENTPAVGGANLGLESGEGLLNRVTHTDAALVRTPMETVPATANMSCTAAEGRTDSFAMGVAPVNNGPAGAVAGNDGSKVVKKRGRKRKTDDENNNTGTGSGNDKPAPRKRVRGAIKNRYYGPRVDTSETATTSAIEPMQLQKGGRSASQSIPNSKDPNAPKWTRRIPSLLDCTDPFICPGPDKNCFHAFQNTGGYWLHVESVHGFKRNKVLGDPAFADIKAIFDPRPRSWWLAQGQDITYQGTDRKQINARRRMAQGIRSNDPNYVEEVYVKTPASRVSQNGKNKTAAKRAAKEAAKQAAKK